MVRERSGACCCSITTQNPAGGKFALDNYFNIAAVLFMWCMIPAFGAAAFVPSLVLGEPCGCCSLLMLDRGPPQPARAWAVRTSALARRRAGSPSPMELPRAAERRLFVRERHDGLYRVATYLIAKMIDGAQD